MSDLTPIYDSSGGVAEVDPRHIISIHIEGSTSNDYLALTVELSTGTKFTEEHTTVENMNASAAELKEARRIALMPRELSLDIPRPKS